MSSQLLPTRLLGLSREPHQLPAANALLSSVVLGLRSEDGVSFASVVESGCGKELVELLPELTRADYRRLQAGTQEQEPSLVG